MIGVCTKCGGMFDTTEEDACTPGVLCFKCDLRARTRPDEPAATRACQAWRVMYYHAMPANVALAHVTETGCTRAEAVETFLSEVCVFLGNARPTSRQRTGGTWVDAAAGIICGNIAARNWHAAVAKRSQVAHQLCEIELQGHAEFAAKWLAWCTTAARTIELCRELVAAAEKI